MTVKFCWKKFLILISFAFSIHCSTKGTSVSDHFDGEKFFNPVDQKSKTFSDLLKWQWNRNAVKWDEQTNEKIPEPVTELKIGEFALTFINHSTFLIQIQTSKKLVNIITDPMFSMRTSPLSFIGPKRVRPPGMEIDKLPTIDIALVSHNHYDHMDYKSLETINEKFSPLFVLPLKNSQYLNFSKKPRIQEKDWNESVDIPELGIKIHVLRAHHWSRRSFNDTNEALWCAFMIETDHATIYFAGDTGYKDHFKQTKKMFPNISLALLPIGAYEPRWFMEDAHMNPEDAVKAHQDLAPKRSIGIHFGTFPLTDEGIGQPVLDLEKAKKAANVNNFEVLKEGETKIFTD